MRARRGLLLCLSLLLAGSAPAAALDTGQFGPVGAIPLPDGAIPSGEADGYTAPAVSADGRYVAFASEAELTADTPPDTTQVFRKDRQTGEVVLVSRLDGAGGAPVPAGAGTPTISADGGRVGFVTKTAVSTLPADGSTDSDAYVRDVGAGTTRIGSFGSTGDVTEYDLSGDGAHVAFTAPAGSSAQVYVRALGDPGRTLVSKQGAGSANTLPDGRSDTPSVNGDGTVVAYETDATDVGAAGVVDTNTSGDVYYRDMADSRSVLVSHRNGSALTAADNGSYDPIVSADADGGTGAGAVAFQSYSTDLTAATITQPEQVYLQPLDGSTALASAAPGGQPIGGRGAPVAVGTDGAFVVFHLSGTSEAEGRRLYRRSGTTATPVSPVGSDAYYADASAGDGSLVAWASARGLTPDNDPELAQVVGRVGSGPLENVSRAAGTQTLRRPVAESVQDTTPVSADGRYVLFSAISGALPDGTANAFRVWRRDLATGETLLVSRGPGAAGTPIDVGAGSVALSADGQHAAFVAGEAVDGASGDNSEVFVRDIAAGTTRLASVIDGAEIDPASGPFGLHLDADGSVVVFSFSESISTTNVWRRDLSQPSAQLMSRRDGAGGAAQTRNAFSYGVSADGDRVLFGTDDGMGVASQGVSRSYVRDVAAGTTRLVSRRDGADGVPAAQDSDRAALSADGRTVAFVTSDPTLVAGSNGLRQIVARDLTTNVNRLVSRSGTTPGNGPSAEPSVSGDGSVIAFATTATNLLPENSAWERIVVADGAGTLSGPPAFGAFAPQFAGAGRPVVSRDGRCVTFWGSGHTATGAGYDGVTPYMFARSGPCPPPLPPATDDGGGGTPPGGTGGQTPPTTNPPSTVARPALGAVSLTNRTFRVGRGRTAVIARRAKAGTTFRATLSAPATLTIRIERQARGRRTGRRCVAPTRRLRKAKRCTRYTRVGTLTRRDLEAGPVAVAFSGRLGRKALKPGRYRATLQAANAGGRSAAARLAFRVVRR